ncbi:NAD(P)(+) transhydrogenase (Re/Si-specific) subunit alpha, partial [Xanthobacter autotrophicus]
MKIAVPAEVDLGEPRVAATPDTVKRLVAFGASVAIETGAGLKSGILDADYEAAGATIAPTAADALYGAEVVLKVR